MKKHAFKRLQIGLILILLIARYPIVLSQTLAETIWSGSGNWSMVSNWSNGVPGVGSIAVFNGTSNSDCIIDVNVTVNGIRVEQGYTHTISQNSSQLSVTFNSNLQQGGNAIFSSGTFSGGSNTIKIERDLTITNNAVFTSTTGVLDLWGNFNLTGTGIFNHNNGNTLLTSVSGLDGTTFIHADSPIEFYNLKLAAVNNMTLTIESNFTVKGTLTTAGGGNIWLINGEISLLGDLKIENMATTGGGPSSGSGAVTTTFIFSGNGDQNIVGQSSDNRGMLPNIQINKTSGTVIFSNTVTFRGNLELLNGLVDAESANPRLIFRGPGTSTGKQFITGTFKVYDLVLTAATFVGNNTIELGSSRVTVINNLSMIGIGGLILNGGNIDIEKDMLISGNRALSGGTTNINIIGSNSHNITGITDENVSLLPNLNLNTSGSIYLSNKISIQRNVDFIKGVLNIQADGLVVFGPNSSVTNANNTSFIKDPLKKLVQALLHSL